MRNLIIAASALALAIVGATAVSARPDKTDGGMTTQDAQCPPGWGCWSYPESGDSVSQGHAWIMVPPAATMTAATTPAPGPLVHSQPEPSAEALDC